MARPTEHIEEAHKGLSAPDEGWQRAVAAAMLHALLAIAETVLELWRLERHRK